MADETRIPPRLTVTATVAHRHPDGRTEDAGSPPYGRALATDEQPFVRRLSVGGEWAPLETGWLKGVGLLVLANAEGRGLRTVPTPAQREEIASRVVEVGVAGPTGLLPCWLVLPGEFMIAHPADPSALGLRCRQGVANVTLTLIPE